MKLFTVFNKIIRGTKCEKMKKHIQRNINEVENNARLIVQSGLYSFTSLDSSLNHSVFLQ